MSLSIFLSSPECPVLHYTSRDGNFFFQIVQRHGRIFDFTLVEAVEDTREGFWAVGVQWHPELGWGDDKLSASLFAALAESASDNVDG